MKKTILIFTIIFTLCPFCFSKDLVDSEINIFNEVNSAFDTGFFPGAVEKANLLQSEYPESVFVLPSLVKKGESLFYIKKYEEAEQTFENAIELMHTGSDDFSRCYYFLGRVKAQLNKNDEALNCFYQACVISLADKSKEFYAPSIISSAKIYYKQNQYSDAIPLYEYVIQNGNQYSQTEYEESLLNLLISYNNTGCAQKTVDLFNQIGQDAVSSDVYFASKLSYGESLELLQKPEQAYDTYLSVAENASPSFAVLALKKSYILATKVLGRVEGEDFAKTIVTFVNDPDLVSEFWLRLGIDEYNQDNYPKAIEYFNNAQNNGAVILYRQKIALEQKQNAAQIEAELLQNENLILNSEFENISDSYYSILLQCKILLQKWDEAGEIYAQITNPDATAVYCNASALYSKKDFYETAAFLNPILDEQTYPVNSNIKLWELYASALARTEKQGNPLPQENALSVYDKIEKDGISNQSLLEYSKLLFSKGRYAKSLQNAISSDLPEGKYIAGICSVNLKNWNDAISYFAAYIKSQSNKPDFNTMALFYKGYSEYCLENYKDSYSTFVRFGMEGGKDNLKYVRSAYEFASKCALQNGEYKNAAIQAENVIKNSITEQDKHSAVLFTAEIYSDYADYEKAISILKPYTEKKDEFAVQALFQIAKIYVKQGKIDDAEKTYEKIYTENVQSDFAEEAMYRSGEIFYSAGDFSKAENRLNKYIYKYVNGKFSEAALFYCGDSCYQLGELEKSIMMNNMLIQKYPQSIYIYGTYKNLLSAYYELENYQEALESAKFLVKNYSEQAASDGIGRKLTELDKIVSGTDPRIAEAISDYEKKGKSETENGRIAGTKLVKLYASNSETRVEAFALANELLPLQTSASEKFYAAQNAEVIAEYNRLENENEKAAQMYLLAAEYYRSSEEGNTNAAAALYGAVEAFVADGYTEDAKETAALLLKLYPESKQARSVRRLVK